MRRKCRPYNYVNVHEIIKSDKVYVPKLKWKFEYESYFLSGDRQQILDAMFQPKSKVVRTNTSFIRKLVIEIGIQELKIRKIVEGKTAKGYPKIIVSWHKHPGKYMIDGEEFNNSSASNKDNIYDTIDCLHLVQDKDRASFAKYWFRPFTNSFSRETLLRIPKGRKFKCIVAHVEEAFKERDKQMYYKQGNRIGQPIVLLKPEIVKVYPLETPNKDIKIDYFKLYKPIKL
jgi:hypothetical protein